MQKWSTNHDWADDEATECSFMQSAELEYGQGQYKQLAQGDFAANWSLSNYGPRIFKRRRLFWSFFAKHFLKRLGICWMA